MDSEYSTLLRTAFDEYLSVFDEDLMPQDSLLEYEYSYITQAHWRPLAETMIQGELREFTNRLHAWRGMLKRWQAWNGIVASREEIPAWILRTEFMEPLVHTCLIMPSALRDLATFVATNAFHQVRIHNETSYSDSLEGDPSETDPCPRPLTRRQKEARLARIAAPLQRSVQFIATLRLIDDETYRIQTKDYRNLNSHAIGPRIALGDTRIVTRKVEPATRMEVQPDGTWRLVEIAGHYSATYSLGGLKPLDLELARTANLQQYTASRRCFALLTDILQLHCAKLPRTHTAPLRAETPINLGGTQQSS